MNAKHVTSFLTGIAVSKGLRFELGKDPKNVLTAIGFSEAESHEIIKELNSLKKASGGGGGHEKVEPWQPTGVWTLEGVWAHSGVWTAEK